MAGEAQVIGLIMQFIAGVGAGITGAVTAEDKKRVINKALDSIPDLPPEIQIDAKSALVDYIQEKDPELIKGTALEGMVVPGEGRSAQLKALEGMQKRSEQGMSDQARLQLAQANAQADQLARGRRGALEQQFAQRGMGSSGISAANQMLANQSAADTRYMQGLGVSSADEQARMQALQNVGSMGGALRGQDYQQASDVANAKDLIARFNATNTNAYNARAQQGQQSQANRNSDTGLGVIQWNAGQKQQGYQNAVNRNNTKYNYGMAGANAEAEPWNNVWGALGQGGGVIGGWGASGGGFSGGNTGGGDFGGTGDPNLTADQRAQLRRTGAPY